MDPWTYAKPTNEHSNQAALFMWSNMAVHYGLHVANHPQAYTEQGWAMKNARGDLIPQLKWLHAIHNQGHGDKVRGSMAKAEGVKAGVADLFLPVPIWQGSMQELDLVVISGFYIEMKVGKNKQSDKQLDFQADMTAAGYRCDVAYSWLEARDKILAYLSI